MKSASLGYVEMFKDMFNAMDAGVKSEGRFLRRLHCQ